MAEATRYDFIKPMPFRHDQDWEGWMIRAVRGDSRILDQEVQGADFDPDPVLETLARLGWVAARWDPAHYMRAWRGDNLPIVRMDFRLEGDRWRVRKWLAGWMASTQPVEDELKPADWDPQIAWTWLQDHQPADHHDYDGWRVKRAGNFVRAWRGPVKAVRNGGQVIQMRDELSNYRNALARIRNGETWVEAERPDWMPESLGLSVPEIEDLNLAVML
jgi:hypothetical protein